jgi:hypothetical protein
VSRDCDIDIDVDIDVNVDVDVTPRRLTALKRERGRRHSSQYPPPIPSCLAVCRRSSLILDEQRSKARSAGGRGWETEILLSTFQ